ADECPSLALGKRRGAARGVTKQDFLHLLHRDAYSEIVPGDLECDSAALPFRRSDQLFCPRVWRSTRALAIARGGGAGECRQPRRHRSKLCLEERAHEIVVVGGPADMTRRRKQDISTGSFDVDASPCTLAEGRACGCEVDVPTPPHR